MNLTMACTIKGQHSNGSNVTSPASMATRRELRLRDTALAQVRVGVFRTHASVSIDTVSQWPHFCIFIKANLSSSR